MRDTARVEHFAPFPYQGINASTRVGLPCGCAIFLDEHGRLLRTRPCMIPHEALIARALALINQGGLIYDPTVISDMLSRASREIRPPKED